MSRRVYSTDQGRLCPDCQLPIKQCRCPEINRQAVPAGDGVVRIRRETKGRKGKGITLITGLPLAQDDLKKLARELKQRCSTGGAVKDGAIEIQGDQRELLSRLLQDRGYHVKFSGG